MAKAEPSVAAAAGATPIDRVRELLALLEHGQDQDAMRVLDEITRLRETQIFQELGKLTRDLHDAITAFRLDERFSAITQVEIPDAKARLHHVINMTEDAASRTLGAVEMSRPLCQSMREQAGRLGEAWERFMRRDMKVEVFRELSGELRDFFPAVADRSARVDASLSDVLLAQEFQDLTSQIIRRVITLVEEVESNLVNLIRISGEKLSVDAAGSPSSLDGPQIPGRKSKDAVSGQDEVDDLLSSLGF